MPEGDTIFRAAGTLHRALAGAPVVRFESVFPALTRVHEDAPLTGRTVESVRSAGKHILMRFSGGLILRTHMRMNGSWHIYRPGERWRRSRHDGRLRGSSFQRSESRGAHREGRAFAPSGDRSALQHLHLVSEGEGPRAI